MEWENKKAETPLPMLDCLPYRLAIADVGDGTSYLFTNYHHIAADGGASDLVLRLVLQAYETLGTGGTPKFSDPLPPSAAFDSEQKYFRSEQFEADKEYWNTLFEAVPDPMDIAGRPAPKTLTMER
ncbi:MAG: condensation domain-containing protein, partial [Desulfovibrionales bacterium]